MAPSIDSGDPPMGVVNLNKPLRWSSAKAVTAVRGLLGGRRAAKVGHAGTLDPLATGVLVLLVGRATKLTDLLMGSGKQYVADVRLGATSTTDDAEGEIHLVSGVRDPGIEAVRAALPRFVGRIDQVPPAHSAVHVDGQRAYKLARGGGKVELPPRPVHVKAIDLLGYDWPILRLRIDCGKGTYIRSLARDIGEALGVGGHLDALQRTRVGPLRLDCAVSLEQCREDNVDDWLRPIEWALTTTLRIDVTDDEAGQLAHGVAIDLPRPAALLGEAAQRRPLAAYDTDGRVIALCQLSDGRLRPTQVLRPL